MSIWIPFHSGFGRSKPQNDLNWKICLRQPFVHVHHTNIQYVVFFFCFFSPFNSVSVQHNEWQCNSYKQNETEYRNDKLSLHVKVNITVVCAKRWFHSYVLMVQNSRRKYKHTNTTKLINKYSTLILLHLYIQRAEWSERGLSEWKQ